MPAAAFQAAKPAQKPAAARIGRPPFSFHRPALAPTPSPPALPRYHCGMPLSRRELLASAPLWMAGCAMRRNTVAPPALAPMARVRVAPDRVIRTIVGLRPFRPSGFVVRGEKLDQKVVIHNYGHGGAGITLSWGTAQLAVAEAAQIETRQAAVIGCGVVGLSTARLLQQRGYAVTIYAKAMPPDTTSNVAGGLWDPVTVYDHLNGSRRSFAVSSARRAALPSAAISRWWVILMACAGCRLYSCRVTPRTSRRRQKALTAKSSRSIRMPASLPGTSTPSMCRTSTGATRC